MSRSEIDAEVLTQSTNHLSGLLIMVLYRPWEPKYPIMTIPPTPIPLLGTSNM